VLQILTIFYTDPDPAFYFDTAPDLDPKYDSQKFSFFYQYISDVVGAGCVVF
jgi:hypothetical protein